MKHVRVECVLTLLMLAICAAFSAGTARPVSAQITVAPTNPPKVLDSSTNVQPAAQQESTQTSQPVVTATPQQQPPVPQPSRACQPNYAYSARPAPLDISSRAPGLSVSSEGPYYYQVFGNTQAEVRAQLNTCGPRSDFAGDASYSISWTYALIRPEGSETCVLTSVKVGLRT